MSYSVEADKQPNLCVEDEGQILQLQRVISIYAPTNDKPDDMKDEFYESLLDK